MMSIHVHSGKNNPLDSAVKVLGRMRYHRLCVVMMLTAVLQAVLYSHVLYRVIHDAVPTHMAQIAFLTTVLVAGPLVLHSITTIRRLDHARHEARSQAAILDQRNAELAEARDALADINDTLESRVHERTTALELARNEAEEASAAKSQFLANMSHELRTPLNAIIGFSDMLIQRKALFSANPEVHTDEYALAIHGSGTHLHSLVNDLLDLARIECGEHDIKPERLDIVRVLRDSVLLLDAQARLRNQTIVTDTDDISSRYFEADARAMRQILVNLLSNALKFSPDGAEIALSVMGDRDGTTFFITDRGRGMSVEESQVALRPFSRFSEAHIASGDSIGLGLSIVNALCTLHGGTLTFISEKGEGTTVRVHIPTDIGRAVTRLPAS